MLSELKCVNPALVSLQAMAKHMKRGVDEKTRKKFRQLLKTQDPRKDSEQGYQHIPRASKTEVIWPAQWRKCPESSSGLDRLKESVFVQRNIAIGQTEPADLNGFKWSQNSGTLFSHFRQEKITGEEPEEAREVGSLERRRPERPVSRPGMTAAAVRSRSAPEWCACPRIHAQYSTGGTSLCSDARAVSALERPMTFTLRRATNEILVRPPVSKKKTGARPMVDQSLELRRDAGSKRPVGARVRPPCCIERGGG